MYPLTVEVALQVFSGETTQPRQWGMEPQLRDGTHFYASFALGGRMVRKMEEIMEYDLKAIDAEISAIEERAIRLKELSPGIEAVQRNADAILTFTYLLKKNISDVIE